MKKGLTEMVFILDRSGSMGGLEDDTIGGFNGLIEQQRKVAGEAVVSTVLFDDRFEVLHDRIAIQRIPPMTRYQYFVRGTTALFDAVGRSIRKIGDVQKRTPEEARAEKVVFVITTDGMENASREYTGADVKALISRQKERFGWEFIFLGANVDAVAEAARFGIGADRAANYHADAQGTKKNFEGIHRAVSELRTEACISADWKDEIDADYAARKKHES